MQLFVTLSIEYFEVGCLLARYVSFEKVFGFETALPIAVPANVGDKTLLRCL